MFKRVISILTLFSILMGLLPTIALPKAGAEEPATRATTAGKLSASTATITDLFEARSQNVHPRIFASEDDFARVRKLVETDPYMKVLYTRIYNYCLTALDEPLLKYEFPNGTLGPISRDATKRIIWLAMAFQISGEGRFAERAVEEMVNVSGFKDWDTVDNYLSTAQMCFAVAIGYDWLYQYMTEAQRTTVRNGLYRNGIATQNPPPKCMTKVNNWNPWCNGGLSIAALSVFENYPSECATIISNAVSNIQLSLTFAPGGAYPEGPGYAAVGLAFTVYFMEALNTVLGTDFGLSEVEGVKESGEYFLATNGYLYNFNYGDGSTTFRNSAILHWYANRYNMPHLSIHQREHQGTTDRNDEYLAMLWYDPELIEGRTKESSRLDYFVKSDEYESIASFRSAPGDEAQIYAAIKSGYNQTGHTDLDVGTFVMEALGEYWFVELGSDSYDLPSYMSRGENGGRWNYYRKRAEGQNTLVINPDATGGQVFDATCQITDYASAYDGGYATVDMKDAYDGYGAKSVKRSLALFNDRTRVRLRDEFSLSSASTVYWFAHTQADISISSDGKTATLTQNGKQLIAQIGSPDEARFTQMAAKPLSSSPNPSGQNANEGYRKLVIKLTKTTGASITVFFTPVLSEPVDTTQLPGWGISNTGKLLQDHDPAATLTENPEGIYEISNVEQLCLLSEMVANGETFAGKTLKLMEDIDMNGRTFHPIGGNGTSNAFRGVFDGNCHVVKNLLIHEPGGDGVALFGRVNGGTIKNFGIESGMVYGGKATAGLIGYGGSITVENCFNRANVLASDSHSGGLIARLSGTVTITNCYNNAYVKNTGSVAGGIVGYLTSSTTATVKNCYHVGNLTDSSGRLGMIGFYNTGDTNPISKITVNNCYATTAIKASDITSNSSIESYSGNGKVTKAQLVGKAVALGSGFIYDCEWENGGYPVLQWQCDTQLPEDLVLESSAELRLLAYQVNSGATSFKGQTIRLGRDIDLDSREWLPIGGNNPTDATGKFFEGSFDGQGYSVSNIRISTGYHHVGFFGHIKGNIYNLGIESGNIQGGNQVGGLAGSATGTIRNCYSRAKITGTGNAGGLVGIAAATMIENSYARADITTEGTAGGLVAYYSSKAAGARITNSYGACTISAKYAGSLVGKVNAAVTDFIVKNSYGLNTYPLVYSDTAYTLSGSSVQSAAGLKGKTSALGSSFRPDDLIARNGGYPVLQVFSYKSDAMTAIEPNDQGIYELHDSRDLRAFAYSVNVLGMDFSNKTIKLCADIDLEGEEWIPIGGNASENGASTHQFSGTFDGGGHCIRNLTVSAGNYYVGFFGDVKNTTILDLGIESGSILGESRVGGIAGAIRNGVTIRGCYNKAAVCGRTFMGGIVGMIGGKDCLVTSCYNTGNIQNEDHGAGIVGYLSSGAMDVQISYSYNAGLCGSGILEVAHEEASGIVDHCYTIDTAEIVRTPQSVLVSSSAKLSPSDLRQSAESLGTAFAEDYFTKNRIYPVLAWENGDRDTLLPSENGVYLIKDPYQLRLLSYMVRKGHSFAGETVRLTADLDLQNELWLPIGGMDEGGKYVFSGSFDGNGHSIRNLNVWEKGLNYGGLFGIISGGSVSHLGIDSGIVVALNYAAPLAARLENAGILKGCYNRAMVYADGCTGGLAGVISNPDSVIESCYNTGEIFARSKQSKTAGLVGYLAADAHHTKLLNSYNQGNYFGLIGSVHASATGATVENCYSASTLRLVRIQEALTTTSSFQISTDTLKTYAPVLGDAYTEDTALVNRGYPILFWQQEGHCFHSYVLTSKDADTHSACCRYCADSYTEAHSYTNGVCACGEEETKAPVVDEEIVINHTLNLASDISLNFAVLSSLLEGYERHYLEVRIPVYQGNALIGTRTVTIEPVVKGSYDYYTLTGLTAVNMNDVVTAQLHMEKDGRAYVSHTDSYSIAQYAYSQLNKPASAVALKKLCADLLRYGKEAQVFKAYRTDALADALMTKEHKAYLGDTEAVTFGTVNEILPDLENPAIVWVGKSLNLDSKVSVKYIFTLGSYNGRVEDLSLRLRYVNYKGEAVQVILTEPTVYDGANQRYAFTFDGLLAAELRTVTEAAIYRGDTALSQTLRYSPDTYGNQKQGQLLLLCKALFVYSDTARAYFQ